jgi:succinate-semialdehyde dehydrogenase/glutarate-semialdehyde dehydrogenase
VVPAEAPPLSSRVAWLTRPRCGWAVTIQPAVASPIAKEVGDVVVALGLRPTLRDVAKLAGVHPATVSRALNAETRALVAADTVCRVEEAAATLGYRPDRLARSLKTGHSSTVGVVVPDLTNPLFPPIVRGIEEGMEARGYVALVANTDNDEERERRVVEEMRDRAVDGIVFATARRHHPLLLECARAGMPLVLVNRVSDEVALASVSADDEAGAHLAVEHLVALGHRLLGHVAGPQHISTGIARLRGFRAALVSAGLDPDAAPVAFTASYSPVEGARCAAEILACAPLPTAIVAANDMLAIGVLRTLRATGLRCPDDVSVVGFNDVPFMDLVDPPLTTVRLPHYEIGLAAAELMLAQIDDPGATPRAVELPSRLVVRSSCGAPRCRRVERRAPRGPWSRRDEEVVAMASSAADLHGEAFAAMAGRVPTRCFVGGDWRPSSDRTEMAVFDPATGRVLVDVADGSIDDATAAVDAASAALPAWAATPPRERSEILRRAFEVMVARKEEMARLVVLENGKAYPDALGEVTYAAEFFRWFAEEAVRNAGEIATAPSGSNKILVLRQPIGVAALVTPWNFPAAMLTRKIGPALAAGCSVVCKPASETPLTALVIAEVLEEAGVPAGVVNVVPTSHSGPFVARLLADPRVRKLSFTGSTEVGRILLAAAADNVVSCSMELGGNAPFVVFDDADLDAAVAGAMVAKMRNGGEACTAANRFYVQAGVAREFSERLARAMGALVMGPGLHEGVGLGPLVNEPSRLKVAELVEAALATGARAVVGGAVPGGPGWFYPATVLADVDPSAAILSTEIFGPVAPVVAFSSEAEVIEMANASEFGLVSYCYTGDLARGLRVAEALECGMVGLNRGIVSDPAAPFGGTKQSGLGREGGHEGMLEYLEQKYIACSW